MYKTKLKCDGVIDKCKALVMTRGYIQIEGIYYTKTFSFIMKPQTIHVFLNLSSSMS